MGLYRKKPVVIEARQLLGPGQFDNGAEYFDYFTELRKWCRAAVFSVGPGNAATLTIDTLEGQMKAQSGDWIIKGVTGEFYPCKPNIFAQTYEKAD